MIILTITMTLIAMLTTLFVTGANSMRSSPGEFVGGIYIGTAWVLTAIFWLAWWLA